MSISYEGIGEWCATFVCGAVSEGDIVKVSANGTVGKCTAGDGFCGVVRAVAHDGKACTVQLGGLASVKYSGTAPAVGYAELMADESEKSMLRMICTAQEESLVCALKEGVAKEDCESAFICAASWLAAAALESARAGGEEFSSLRAGDLTVTKCSSDEGSKRLSLLREQAWALMRPYTTDGGF